MGTEDPYDFLRSWPAEQRRRERAARVEGLVALALLAAMVIGALTFLARLDARSEELVDLVRDRRVQVTASP